MSEDELKAWLKDNLVVDLDSDGSYITLKIGFVGDIEVGKYYTKQKFFIEAGVSHNHV